ncbi:MAG: MerR family transcriptional regulator [Rhizobiales bacterium]|nr:MerR family transcriptional regulator [Hyphomicrobiales bacterium]
MDALVNESLRRQAHASEAPVDAEIVDFLFIGELSRAVGISARAIRFYEKQGLIAPARHGRFRVYRRSDEARLRAVGRLRALGFPIALIRESLDCFLSLDATENRLGAIALVERHIANLERRQAEIAEERALAQALHAELTS